MVRTNLGPESVSRLQLSTGDCYSSQDADPVPVTQTSTFGERVTPPRADAPSDSDWVHVPDGFDENSHDGLVGRLETAADAVTDAIGTEAPESLREAITEWCALHGGDDPSAEHTRTIIARQAVLYVLLKATLYEWHHQYEDLPQLPTDTRAALRRAAEQTGNPAFNEYVLDEIVWLADDANLAPVLDAHDWLLDSGEPAEAIGRLYADLVSTDDRQMLGQFRTPPSVGSLMRAWAASGDDNMLDPGMGAGVLSGPFHPLWDVSTEPAHVNGVDRSPLSRLMGTTALTLYRQAHDTQVIDFLSLSLDDLDRDVDAIICNPPYTSGDSLPDAYKNRINTQIEQTIGRKISARSPLYAYFVYHSRQFLSVGDRAAVIMPQSFLTARYGEPLKQFLLDEFDVRALVQFDPGGERVFETAQTTALIAFLEVSECAEHAGVTRFIRVDQWPGAGGVRYAVNNGQQGGTDWGFVNRVEQTQLSADSNWQALFDPHSIDTSSLTPLGDLVSIQRGKTTGCVDFFCLSETDIEAAALDDRYLSRLVRRPMYIDGYDFRDEDWEELRANDRDVWLFDPCELPGVPASAQTFRAQAERNDIGDNGEDHDLSDVVGYLKEGIADHDLHEVGCLTNRPYWYRPRRERSRRVLVRNASRDGFRFILNETATRHINNMYALYDVTLSELELKALLAFLNSNVFDLIARDAKKTRDGGFDAIQPNELESVPVLDPTSLPGAVVTRLAELFDELCETTRQNGNCEPVHDRLTSIIKTQLERSSNPN